MQKLTGLHLFEFMDLDWMPSGFRHTMREILECVNSRPFRPYYEVAVGEILDIVEANQIETIVELGAGTAPLSKLLAQDEECTAKIIPCDLNPDHEAYHTLEAAFQTKVAPKYECVDFFQPQSWPTKSLLVLSATLHHLPGQARAEALRTMAQSADAVIIIEPLRRTTLSMLFVCGSLIPALLIPLFLLNRTGTLRRLFWCWLFPVAPAAFLWDGWVSCLRQWSDEEYRAEIARIEHVTGSARHTLFTQVITLLGQSKEMPSQSVNESC